MSHHLVVGAGPVGAATALELSTRGHEVTVVSRRGLGPSGPGITLVRADAGDVSRVQQLAAGAVAVYNCLNPAYHRWPTDWPPMAGALLRAAESSGAVLATVGNLYPYGPVEGPMTPQTPMVATGTKARVRTRMWEQALQAHREGRVRVTEVRGSDYVTAGPNSHLGDQVTPRLLTGRAARFLVPVDHPHTFTHVPDVATTLVEAAAQERAWGRAWHVPSPPPVTPRQAVADLCDVAGVPPARVQEVPGWAVRAVGVAVPMLRELRETRYQFEMPYVLDASQTTAKLGVGHTPWGEALESVVAAYRDDLAGRATAAR